MRQTDDEARDEVGAENRIDRRAHPSPAVGVSDGVGRENLGEFGCAEAGAGRRESDEKVAMLINVRAEARPIGFDPFARAADKLSPPPRSFQATAISSSSPELIPIPQESG